MSARISSPDPDLRHGRFSCPQNPILIGKAPIALGGSWVVISRVVSRITILITDIRGLIATYNYP